MAELSKRETQALVKKNDSLTRRMGRIKSEGERTMSAVAGTSGRALGALAGGRFLSDKDIGGMNYGYISGLLGIGIQIASDAPAAQFIGGVFEGPLNGLLYKYGEDMADD